MCDRENPDLRCGFERDYAVRKTRHRTPTNRQAERNSRNQAARPGHLHNLINRGVNGIEELDAQVLPTLFVRPAGEAILGVRFVLKPNARIHLRRSSASARRRTSSQGIPADSPVITRRARRSISSAQAAPPSPGLLPPHRPSSPRAAPPPPRAPSPAAPSPPAIALAPVGTWVHSTPHNDSPTCTGADGAEEDA